MADPMQVLPIRLTPGQDLRTALEAAVRGQGAQTWFGERVVSAVPGKLA